MSALLAARTPHPWRLLRTAPGRPLALCTPARCVGYRSYDTSRTFSLRRRRGGKGGAGQGSAEPLSSSTDGAAAAGLGAAGSSLRRREGGLGVRPAQSAAQDRKDAERDFPTTLPSGRPAQRNTMSQRLFYERRSNIEEVARQEQIDREYVRKMREAQQSRTMDRRFFAKVEDYRDIGESDPYADIFGESASTHRLRTAAWQRQFEKENEGVELPYERTNAIAKLAPNWFVRYFVNLRDKGGTDNLHAIYLCFIAAASLLWVVGYLFYTSPTRSRPVSEIR